MKKMIVTTSFFVLFVFAGTVSAGDGFGIRAGLFGFDIVNINLDLPSSPGFAQSHNVYYVTSPDPSLSISATPHAPGVKGDAISINVENSSNVSVVVQESKSAPVQPSKPVVIYYPSQTRSYYYYRPFGW